MSTLVKTTAVEGRLILREPGAVLFAVLFPAGLLLALGAIPILREPSEEYGGARFVEIWAPTALALGIGIMALQHIPVIVATYREKGILRRMSTTPVHPAQLLIAQLIVTMVLAVIAAVLLVVSAWLLLDVSLPQHPGWFVVAFLVGFAAMLAIGMLVAAVAPTAKLANSMTMVAWMVLMFIGGVFLPRIFFPEPLQRAGDYSPPGVQALQDAWSGDPAVAEAVGATAGPPEIAQLGIMALIALVVGGAAARLFRWE